MSCKADDPTLSFHSEDITDALDIPVKYSLWHHKVLQLADHPRHPVRVVTYHVPDHSVWNPRTKGYSELQTW